MLKTLSDKELVVEVENFVKEKGYFNSLEQLIYMFYTTFLDNYNYDYNDLFDACYAVYKK